MICFAATKFRIGSRRELKKLTQRNLTPKRSSFDDVPEPDSNLLFDLADPFATRSPDVWKIGILKFSKPILECFEGQTDWIVSETDHKHY